MYCAVRCMCTSMLCEHCRNIPSILNRRLCASAANERLRRRAHDTQMMSDGSILPLIEVCFSSDMKSDLISCWRTLDCKLDCRKYCSTNLYSTVYRVQSKLLYKYCKCQRGDYVQVLIHKGPTCQWMSIKDERTKANLEDG